MSFSLEQDILATHFLFILIFHRYLFVLFNVMLFFIFFTDIPFIQVAFFLHLAVWWLCWKCFGASYKISVRAIEILGPARRQRRKELISICEPWGHSM